MAWFAAEIFAAALFAASGAAASDAAVLTVPADVRVDESDRTLTFASGETAISSVTLCPGQVFDQFGAGGPTFSPDFHWVLVDVLGPFAPGNVARNHALIDVRTGGLILAPRFPDYVDVPSSLGGISWASGERATLRYAQDGRTADLHDPPLRPLPIPSCR